MRKPATRAGYPRQQGELVRATCLYVATRLGDLRDDLVVIGGLVPSLLVDQHALPAGVEAHVGTLDLDLGLTLALLDEGRYRALTERLRDADFEPDKSDEGQPTRQRWRIDGEASVTVDFLIQPSRPEDRGGRIRNIERDFAAIIAPGLQVAFRDRVEVRLSGRTILGESAERSVWVCGAGAYLVLKALAFHLRGENKDAYDLYYVLRNYGLGPRDVAGRLATLLDVEEAQQALEVLQRDFTNLDQVGPRRVAQFLFGERDDMVQAVIQVPEHDGCALAPRVAADPQPPARASPRRPARPPRQPRSFCGLLRGVVKRPLSWLPSRLVGADHGARVATGAPLTPRAPSRPCRRRQRRSTAPGWRLRPLAGPGSRAPGSALSRSPTRSRASRPRARA